MTDLSPPEIFTRRPRARVAASGTCLDCWWYPQQHDVCDVARVDIALSRPRGTFAVTPTCVMNKCVLVSADANIGACSWRPYVYAQPRAQDPDSCSPGASNRFSAAEHFCISSSTHLQGTPCQASIDFNPVFNLLRFKD